MSLLMFLEEFPSEERCKHRFRYQ